MDEGCRRKGPGPAENRLSLTAGRQSSRHSVRRRDGALSPTAAALVLALVASIPSIGVGSVRAPGPLADVHARPVGASGDDSRARGQWSGVDQIQRDGRPDSNFTYYVGFVEDGLPTGTQWTVVLDGTDSSSSNLSTLEFVRLTGENSWYVDPVAGYSVAPQSGTFENGTTIVVTFTSASSGGGGTSGGSGSSSGTLGLPRDDVYAVIAVIIVGVALGAGTYFYRTRSSTKPPPPPP